METLKKFRNFIDNLEDKELYQYILLACGLLIAIMGIFIYIHYSYVNKYKNEIEQVNKQRQVTKKILTEYKLVNQQQDKVEEILAQNKNFIITKEFKDIIQKIGLESHMSDEPKRVVGETIRNKTEMLLNAHLEAISMKQLTDLLSEISDIPQLYPIELTIKKTPNNQTVNVDLTIATLESSSLSE